jgi:hypothetical protein
MDLTRKHPPKLCRSTLFLSFLMIITFVFLWGCASKTPTKQADSNSEEALATESTIRKKLVAERAKRRKLEKANQKLKKALQKKNADFKELEKKNASLRRSILEKETQIKELNGRHILLQKKLDGAFTEVVRAKAKLHSLESKAEAASNMAEAEVALKALRARSAGQEKTPEVIQAEYLLKKSAREFERQNYGGALYLAGQAKSLVIMGKTRMTNRGKIPIMAGEMPFVLPVPLRVLAKSNVREGPGHDFKVLFTLAKDTPVIGHSYKDQWVWVKSKEGRGGWIFHSLVEGR